MQERRRAKRIAVYLAINTDNGGSEGSTYLLDISETGAKIATQNTYAAGDPVEFSLVLPEVSLEIHRRGQAVWITPHPTKPGHSLVGLNFLAPWELGRPAP